MKTKIIEIQGKTFKTVALATQMLGDNKAQSECLRTAGFTENKSFPSVVLLLLDKNKQVATNNPYNWEKLGYEPQTMLKAHTHIIERFTELSDGDIVDVESILRETTERLVAAA
jgi:hypothetical protein